MGVRRIPSIRRPRPSDWIRLCWKPRAWHRKVSDMVTRQNGLSTVFATFFGRSGDFSKKITYVKRVKSLPGGKSAIFFVDARQLTGFGPPVQRHPGRGL